MIFSFLHLYWKESSLQKKKVDGEGEVVALCNSEPIAEFYLGGGLILISNSMLPTLTGY